MPKSITNTYIFKKGVDFIIGVLSSNVDMNLLVIVTISTLASNK